MPVVALVGQCAKGVQFNQADYLCREFLENCCKAQEQGKNFHYAWLLLSIVLVAWELPKKPVSNNFSEPSKGSEVRFAVGNQICAENKG